MSATATAIEPKKYSLARDVYDEFWERYTTHPNRKLHLTDKHFAAVNKARVCQTKVLGYAVFGCTDCGRAHHVYQSCKHRFCPRCGTGATNIWADTMLHKVLNIKHSHIVATLPAWLRGLAFANEKQVFGAMFRVIVGVFKSYFQSKFGLEPGIVAVLHTAGSDLKRHPHLHLLVTWGGQKSDGDIVELDTKYLIQHQFLAKRWQHAMQTELIRLYDKGLLKTKPSITNRIDFLFFIKSQNRLQAAKNDTLKSGWVVNIQAPLCDAESIVRYIGRYTKRACLSERKIVKIAGEYITIQYNDYKNTPDGEAAKQAFKTFHYVTFLDALLQHVPEKGFQQVRYYGIYSSAKVNDLPAAYKLPAKTDVTGLATALEEDAPFFAYRNALMGRGQPDPLRCACCQKTMVLVAVYAATTKPKPALPFAQWRTDGAQNGNTS